MPIFTFSGRMLPDLVPMTIPYRPRLEVRDAVDVPDMQLELSVDDGRIVVTVEVSSEEPSIPDRALVFVGDLAQTAANVAAIDQGVAFIAHIERVRHPDGTERGLVLADRDLASRVTVFDDFSYEEVFDLVATDIPLSRAMEDLTVMLRWSHYAPIASGRVAESILRMTTGGGTASHWEDMRTILRVDRAYVQFVTDRSRGPRHGDREAVSGADNTRLARCAWELMNRYLVYKLGGERSLDPDRFPFLEG